MAAARARFESASLVETVAVALGCPSCTGRMVVQEHRAEYTPDLLHIFDMQCRMCGMDRRTFVRITTTH